MSMCMTIVSVCSGRRDSSEARSRRQKISRRSIFAFLIERFHLPLTVFFDSSRFFSSNLQNVSFIKFLAELSNGLREAFYPRALLFPAIIYQIERKLFRFE